MHPSPFSAREGKGWASYQIFKKGGFAESQFLEGGCWERGGEFFYGVGGGGVGGGGVQFLYK